MQNRYRMGSGLPANLKGLFNTVSQIAQRASFKLMAKAYRSFGGVLRKNFTDKPETESAYNVFMRINLPEAIDKSSGVPVIDYSKLQV